VIVWSPQFVSARTDPEQLVQSPVAGRLSVLGHGGLVTSRCVQQTFAAPKPVPVPKLEHAASLLPQAAFHHNMGVDQIA